MAGKLVVVVGGQYGSEGKGAVVAHLTRTEARKAAPPPLVIRVGGPNAGHTAYADGKRWALRQIPAGVVEPGAALAIGAGSEIDPVVLGREIAALEEARIHVSDRLMVDPQATVLTQAHHDLGSREVRNGSTGKGVGVARAARLRRRAAIARDWSWNPDGWALVSVAERARLHMQAGGTVIVEGTQGYALGLHAGHYPYTTSGDCTALDMLAQAQLSPWDPCVRDLEVWVVLRTHPIRVANNEGSSGYLRNEVSWEELEHRTHGHVQPERTTVTQKLRRVGEWDEELAQAAIGANGGRAAVRIALTMFDYWHPEVANMIGLTPAAEHDVQQRERNMGAHIGLVGTGPQTIVDRRAWR